MEENSEDIKLEVKTAGKSHSGTGSSFAAPLRMPSHLAGSDASRSCLLVAHLLPSSTSLLCSISCLIPNNIFPTYKKMTTNVFHKEVIHEILFHVIQDWV